MASPNRRTKRTPYADNFAHHCSLTASGIGHAVAQSLAAQGADAWSIHLVGRNVHAGEAIVTSLGSHVHFHQTDVTCYTSLSRVFQTVFAQSGSRLDFVFANAGLVDQIDFYTEHPVAVAGNGLLPPPPEPNQQTIDIGLKSVVNTAYLTLHYMRHSKVPGSEIKDPSLVITASCGSVYASEFSPMYAVAKRTFQSLPSLPSLLFSSPLSLPFFCLCVVDNRSRYSASNTGRRNDTDGVLGLMRAIAGPFYHDATVRVNCVCPGPTRTNLLDEQSWSLFKKEHLTPLDLIVEVVTTFVAGTELIDARGWAVAGGADMRDQAVITSGENLYFWKRPEFVDETMAEIMGTTKANKPGALKVN